MPTIIPLTAATTDTAGTSRLDPIRFLTLVKSPVDEAVKLSNSVDELIMFPFINEKYQGKEAN
jgi:hypothetical protein